LKIDPEVSAKKEIWQKREAYEFKKLEKILKKEKNDFEDTASTGAKNIKTVYDRFMKTFN
jgi:division protein CdvB (Snf7/Vps24/ESCRT-III family)